MTNRPSAALCSVCDESITEGSRGNLSGPGRRFLLHSAKEINNRAGCLCQSSHSLLKKQQEYPRKLPPKSLPGLRQGCRTFSGQKLQFILRMLVGITAVTRQACT